MEDHKYILQFYNGIETRHQCPECGQKSIFALFIDAKTGESINPKVGQCEREYYCGYQYTPKQYFQDQDISIGNSDKVKHVKPFASKPIEEDIPSFIDPYLLTSSLEGYDSNMFIQYLSNQLNVDAINDLIAKYYIGSSSQWPVSTIFYQIDINKNIRTGKIALYDTITGKENKEHYWVHSSLKQDKFNLQQCFFGEHLLLQDKTKPVAIVVNEKTAIIASVYLPQFIWIAADSLDNLTDQMYEILKDRTVVLYPDLNKEYNEFKVKAEGLSHITNFTVSKQLKNIATEDEKKNGLDLADYLLRYNHKDFIQFEQIPASHEPRPIIEEVFGPKGNPETAGTTEKVPEFEQILFELINESKPAVGDENDLINDLDANFKTTRILIEPIKHDKNLTVNEKEKYTKNFVSIIKTQSCRHTLRTNLEKLLKLKLNLSFSLNVNTSIKFDQIIAQNWTASPLKE
jgi:hypothetical protein